MTTFADIKHVIDTRFDGKHETGGKDGKSGNITFIWADLQPSFQGQPYCFGGVSDIWRIAGHPYPAIDHPWGGAYTPDGVVWAKKHGLWQAGGTYKPGDSIFFDWGKNGHADHVGVVIKDMGSWVYTFECNTSAPGDTYGSQRNGGGNYYRKRPKNATILGVLQSSKWLVAPTASRPAKVPPKPPTTPLRANPYRVPVLTSRRPVLKRGATMAKPEVQFVQWAVTCPVDGVWGNQTTAAVKTFQKYHRLLADGVVGSQTLGALRKVTRH